MFILFKKRDFGDYVSDTFQFFKATGRHYLKNYFTISGILLVILAGLTYFLFHVYFDFIISGRLAVNKNLDYLQNFTETNLGLIIIGAILFFIFIIFLSMLNYSIPVIYLDLYAKNKGNSFGAKDILDRFKSSFGRILIFFLGLFFIVTPLLILIFTLLVLLCFIIIGIPLILFAIPTAMSWITLSFYEFLNNDKNFFEALGSGFKHIQNQYFPNIGSLMIIYIIIQIAMSVFTIIPYAFGMASLFTSNGAGDHNETLSTIKVLITIIMVISILMSYILNNLLFINQGLVYYSRRENDENISSKDSIDLIGSE